MKKFLFFALIIISFFSCTEEKLKDMISMFKTERHVDCPEKIYALYSGSSIKELVETGKNVPDGTELIVYNYNLEEQAHYKLDVPLRAFTLDDKTNTIYGIGYLPEATLVKFKLP